MRYDYLERFEPYFKHGFKRLLEEGAIFTDAHHQHAITHTAPGHATLSTGCYPSKHGVVENDFFNGETYEVDYCVIDDKVEIIGVDNDGALEGKSPRNLKRSTLGDWFKKSDRDSKVYSVAFKDRASILLSGEDADRAFWFDNLTTRFVSSSYYKEAFPEWALSFDAKTLMAEELEAGWTKKFPEEVYKASREDNFFAESGQFLPYFPHTKKYILGRVNPAMKDAILLWTSPLGDAFAIKFAERLIQEENLGQDDHVDILNLGCSMADAIGHHFGPYSQEIQDYYLQMDEYLGAFFDFLDNKIGKEHYVVALSSDHGVLPMPEYLAREGKSARRILSQDFDTGIEQAAEEVSQELGLTKPFLISYGTTGFSLQYEEAYEKRVKPAKLQETFAKALEKLDFVEEVFTTAKLEERDPKDEFQRLFQNSFYPDRGYEMKIRYKENYLVNHRSTGTSHGTPYDYDTHVPMIFMGANFRPGKYDERVGTVDFAPTVANALGVKIDKGVDGKVLVP
jgi:predicted AlkP superfamily pyrophosphatase or phosphodiesterase